MGTDLTTAFAGREVETSDAFRLRLLAEELTLRRPQSDFDAMESLDSSRDTILYPHQIHAAHRFGIRTLCNDVPEIEWTARHPRLFNFTLFDEERELYEGVSDYLSRPNWAFGDNAAWKYLIVLVYRKLLASSSFALQGALRKVLKRLEDMAAGIETEPLMVAELGPEAAAVAREIAEDAASDPADPEENGLLASLEEEIAEVRGYVGPCESIQENAKGVCLVKAMPDLLKQGDRVLVFTQYKATQAYLARKLEAAGHSVVRFPGDLNSHPNPDKDERELAKRAFEREADVMIATDAGAEGINLQFCHLVVNYDLPWNPMKIERRIGRCHRLGQRHEVELVSVAQWRLV